MRIITQNIQPPIFEDQFDWCAYYENDQETGPYGYGTTEQEAIDDLVMNYESEYEDE